MFILKSLLILYGVLLVNGHNSDYQKNGQVPLSAEMPVIYNRPVLQQGGYVPSFSGISTFAHLPYLDCWDKHLLEEDYDIAIMGVPYDIGVTFRTGARFGPSAIREGSKRIKVHLKPRGKLIIYKLNNTYYQKGI